MPLPHRPNSLRHPDADYSDPGCYFLTLCTKDRESLFGEVINGEMKCNPFGSIVWRVWKSLPIRYPNISIDAAIVMPDHFHGIIVIHDPPYSVGAVHNELSTVGAIHAVVAPPNGLCERGETAPTIAPPPTPSHNDHPPGDRLPQNEFRETNQSIAENTW